MRKNKKNVTSSEQQCLFVGDSLKQARQSKKMEVEDVAQQLYINPSIITHLEEENFDQIGAEVFIKGHLKNYAQFLDLPVEKIFGNILIRTTLFPYQPRLKKNIPLMEPSNG